MAARLISRTARASVPHVFKRHSIADLAGGSPAWSQPWQSRAHYLRFPQIVKKAKEIEVNGSLASSAFCSSSPSKEVGVVGWYLGMVKCRPILTKSVTSSLIYVAADLSSQTLAQKWDESYDLARTLQMASYGLFVLGPSLHFWFNFMSKLFPRRDLMSTLKKMAMGQAIYGPAMTVVFFSMNAQLQGETSGEIMARLKRDMLPTLLNGLMYWPACDFINFRFVPIHLQPLVSNSFSYLWTIYLTYMASREKAKLIHKA